MRAAQSFWNVGWNVGRAAVLGAFTAIVFSLVAFVPAANAAGSCTVGTEAQLVSAFQGTDGDCAVGDTIMLGDGITSLYGTAGSAFAETPDALLAIPNDSTITVDLNGQQLYVQADANSEAGITVPQGSTLIIEDSSAGHTGVLNVTGGDGLLESGTGGGAGIGTGGTYSATQGNLANNPATAGTVEIDSGTVTATGGTGSYAEAQTLAASGGGGAGIGGGGGGGGDFNYVAGAAGGASGAVTIGGDATVNAIGGASQVAYFTGGGGAGIGGGGAGGFGQGAGASGPVHITGGTVTASGAASGTLSDSFAHIFGGGGGAGIGGGGGGGYGQGGGSAADINISGGQVTTTGAAGNGQFSCGGGAAGIGGGGGGGDGGAGDVAWPLEDRSLGTGGSASTIEIGGSVTATGGSTNDVCDDYYSSDNRGGGGAAVGGGGGGRTSNGGSGGAVTISSTGDLTLDGGGVGGDSEGAGGGNGDSVGGGGSGYSTGGAFGSVDNGGTINLAGALFGDGTVTNDGTIDILSGGSIAGNGTGDGTTGLSIVDYNYELTFDDNNGSGGSTPLSVYGPSIGATNVSLPAAPSSPANTAGFEGWFTAATGGTQLMGDTPLMASLDLGPATETLYAHYVGFTAEPTNVVAAPGDNAVFSASSYGTPGETFDWQSCPATDPQSCAADSSGWQDIAGQDTSTLTVSNVQPGDYGTEYRAQVALAGVGTADSGTAELTAPEPSITSQPADVSAYADTNASFTIDTSGSPAPNIQWQVCTGADEDCSAGSDNWTNIQGETNTTLSVAVTTDLYGNDYRAVLSGVGYTLDSNSAALNVLFPSTSNPHGVTVLVGRTATFTITQQGPPSMTIQWQQCSAKGVACAPGSKDWTNIKGATADTLTLKNVPYSDNGNGYRAVYDTPGYGTGEEDAARLTVLPNPTITAHISSAHPKTKYGWYGSPVKISFTCTAPGSKLTTPCLKTVTLAKSKAGQTVTGAVKAADGGSYTYKSPKLNIDTTKPKITVKGVKDHASYHGKAPKLTCKATDKISGIAGACKVKTSKHTKGSVMTVKYTAAATSRAGNRTLLSGSYKLIG